MIKSLSQLDLNQSYTVADYLSWRFQERVELFLGKIFAMSPAPTSLHQIIAGNIHAMFWETLRRKPCKVFIAPFDVYLPTPEKNTVVQPDICVVCDPNKIKRKGCVGSPDLVIEILSPGNTKKEMRHKYDLYEQCGITEYWVVFAEEQILQRYILNEQGVYQALKPNVTGDTISPSMIPEMSILIDEVFE